LAHEAQLEWEKRIGRPVAVAALVSAVLSLVGPILQASALRNRGDGDRGILVALDRHSGEVVAATIVQAASLLLLIAVLWFLYRATRHRRPELPQFAIGLAVAGPLLLAIASLASQLDLLGIASDFVDSGGRTEARADDLLQDRSPVWLALGFAGQLALGFALVFLSLNAMRVGLLSRFLGVLGILVGVFTVIPLIQAGIVRLFWLAALGALFLGRWPGGRGPAWETGEADRWPTAADRRAEREPAEGEEGVEKRRRKRRL
jgi:uncharacterized membrane protein HdeD (DUF308 family)